VYTEHFGVEWYESPEIHEKSPINWLPDACNIRYFGSCKGRVTASYSNVVATPIADKVTEVCGHEKEYSGPHFHRWKSWYESLVYSCNPAIGCETEILDWAVQDYENQLFTVLDVDGIMDEVRKLDEIEIVSGRDGVKFINALEPKTSPGYPLTGAKDQYYIQLEPNEVHNCPRTFFPGIWEEVRRFKACLRTGQRYYPMFKACLKDEATPIEKEKVRVFQAAPLVLQIVIREYFLPIARVMSLFPLVSECAVGINAMGPEWDTLQDHVKKYGADRIVAGDYSKYDLRMSAKLTSAAFKIMIDFAEKCGYSQEDLDMMRCIATEVVYPMMCFNGDIVMLQGSNPSGQNLTVYINSIVNSLLNRIGFKKVYPDFSGRFCDAVALATYGDDFKSSASEKYPEFHHLSLAERLASIDMKITMPDKEAEPIPFLTDEACDFLKRSNRFHEVGYYLGTLDENSIFKSLKAVLRSKHCSLKEQSAQNIDGALREWFFHGKDVYEKRREQMKIVAEESGISHMCTLLNETFEDRIKNWQEKYQPLEPGTETIIEEDVVCEPHSGVEHDLCDFGNCTYPGPGECVYNNCSPSYESILQQVMWNKIYLIPLVIVVMTYVGRNRVHFNLEAVSFWKILVLLFIVKLEGFNVWWQWIQTHYNIITLGYVYRGFWEMRMGQLEQNTARLTEDVNQIDRDIQRRRAIIDASLMYMRLQSDLLLGNSVHELPGTIREERRKAFVEKIYRSLQSDPTLYRRGDAKGPTLR
jgi:hypothetical protein